MYCGICLVSLTIALGFALLGFWLILPFAGLELIALAIGFYVCAVRNSTREVISIRGATIAIEKGRRAPQQTTQLPRAWARVELTQSARRGHPARLFICSHGRAVEIGRCLNDNERTRLAQDLRHWIRPATSAMQAA